MLPCQGITRLFCQVLLTQWYKRQVRQSQFTLKVWTVSQTDPWTYHFCQSWNDFPQCRERLVDIGSFLKGIIHSFILFIAHPLAPILVPQGGLQKFIQYSNTKDKIQDKIQQNKVHNKIQNKIPTQPKVAVSDIRERPDKRALPLLAYERLAKMEQGRPLERGSSKVKGGGATAAKAPLLVPTS